VLAAAAHALPFHVNAATGGGVNCADALMVSITNIKATIRFIISP